MAWVWFWSLVLLTQMAGAASYKMLTGDSVATVAQAFYGAKAYSLTVAKFNRLSAGENPAEGSLLRVPDLKTMVFREGLSRELEDEVDQLLAARYEYMKIENELRKSLVRATPDGQATIPAAIQKKLEEIARDFERAGAIMAKKGAYAESAVRVRQRLDEAARNLRTLATGSGDEKLADSIHRLLAQTWVRLLSWARREDG